MLTFHSRHGSQPTRCTAECDDCGSHTTFTCAFENTGQANKKLTAMGWRVGKKHICDVCVTSAKAKEKTVTEKPVAPPPNEPTRAQKRAIMDALEDNYDVDKGRYIGGATDETLAKDLSVLPGWIAKVREEFFGPDGGNEDIDKLIDAATSHVAKLQHLLRDNDERSGQLRVAIRETQDLLTKLDAIKKAVGPRVLKVANVQ